MPNGRFFIACDQYAAAAVPLHHTCVSNFLTAGAHRHDCLAAELDVTQAEQVAGGRLVAGGLYNETVLCAPAAPLQAHLVARAPGTVVISFELTSITRALGAPGGAGVWGLGLERVRVPGMSRTQAECRRGLLWHKSWCREQDRLGLGPCPD